MEPVILPSQPAAAFMKLVKYLSYQQGPCPEDRGLTNLTFWAGAGFSKAWDPKAPAGSELFTFETELIDQSISLYGLSLMFGFDSLNKISYDQLRQIVYQLDMYERYPDVRSRYIDDQNIRLLRAALRSAVIQRYKQITELNYLDTTSGKFQCLDWTPVQQDIIGLFVYLRTCVNGSEPLIEGIRTHFVTTNYDFVIETILDAILGEEDSLFNYTYRGFTPTRVAKRPNVSPVHHHELVWHLLKINGGFEILADGENYLLDYNCRNPEDILKRPPTLILPSREQNYGDPYFHAIFPKAVRLLRETQILVLVGYSLPEDDALIRFILRQFAEAPEDGRGKYIFYIDPVHDQKKGEALAQVFPMIEEKGPELYPFKGGFDTFAAECLRLVSPSPH